jgi:hypothetical protein
MEDGVRAQAGQPGGRQLRLLGQHLGQRVGRQGGGGQHAQVGVNGRTASGAVQSAACAGAEMAGGGGAVFQPAPGAGAALGLVAQHQRQAQRAEDAQVPARIHPAGGPALGLQPGHGLVDGVALGQAARVQAGAGVLAPQPGAVPVPGAAALGQVEGAVAQAGPVAGGRQHARGVGAHAQAGARRRGMQARQVAAGVEDGELGLDVLQQGPDRREGGLVRGAPAGAARGRPTSTSVPSSGRARRAQPPAAAAFSGPMRVARAGPRPPPARCGGCRRSHGCS